MILENPAKHCLPIFMISAGLLAASVEPMPAPSSVSPLPMKVGGRVLRTTAKNQIPSYTFQWPGTYFESAFEGTSVGFSIGPGHVIYNLSIDGIAQPPLVKPPPGYYQITDLADGRHVIRLETATESQSGPNHFGGFIASAKVHPLPSTLLPRMIEVIGDSHSVGYGNTSKTRTCSPDEIWSTTNTSLAYGALLAKHYHAEYQINAYSGRGIVRNYDGFKAPPLPELYPYVLFDQSAKAETPDWHPQVIVINLGTNDFTTALHPNEKWKSRDELHADYENTYATFVRTLRKQNPQAYFVLVANDMADGEIQREVQEVVKKLSASGETRVGYVALPPMELTGCDWHPSLDDHLKMMGALVTIIDQNLGDKW